MRSRLQLSRDLVLVGGGHAHALVLKRLGMNPLPGARLTVINPGPTAPYTGMLPGYVAGHYTRDQLDIDLVRLCRFAGARLILDYATRVDQGHIALAGRPPVAFDIASLDIGIHGALPSIAGLADHGVPAKPLGVFADRWEAFLAEVAGGEAPTICVIGGGIAGVELALAMAHRLGAAADVTIVEGGDDPLRSVGGRARRALIARMDTEGVQVLTGARVAAVEPAGVTLEDGQTIPARLTVAAAGAVPYDWLADSGLPVTDGYVRVGETLQVEGRPDLFAVGDCAHLTHDPREKAGVFAVRQAPILTENLRAALKGLPAPKTYSPQTDYLKLISTGSKTAAMDRNGLSLHGALLWRWKDHIDRKFMDSLTDLPVMRDDTPDEAATDAIADRALCGGCGAKAGRQTLRAALADLPAPARGDVLLGAGDDAGLLAHGGGVQAITTDTLRGFTDDPYLLAHVAAVHALGDVWAMGARPQAAVLTVTLPRMTAPLEARTLAEITRAVSDILTDAGAALVGGHTGLGAELSVGLTVTGLADRAVRATGAKAGDVLVLTKPLGTGTILAGEMAGLARGADVAACWTSMTRSLAGASAILAPAATAMTDVTGFGLAAHAEGFGEAGIRPVWDLDALPFLPGALDLARAGVRSSLYAHNGGPAAPTGPREALLYDPQTAGGLLAAVPPGDIEAILARMKEAEEPAWVIGKLA